MHSVLVVPYDEDFVYGGHGKLLSDDTRIPSDFIVMASAKMTSDYKVARVLNTIDMTRFIATAKWQPPACGRLKVNVDGSWRLGEEFGEVDAIIRDHSGQVKVAGMMRVSSVGGLSLVELVGFSFGIRIAHGAGLYRFILEGDALAIVQDNIRIRVSLSSYDFILDDIWAQMAN
ncbi:uncharacterized protein LOC119995569 [Tripterygium wilfordii]|uniref:uncharacterized protein LOC119995569 n=1 Tax=Tripterygium wilfordii TaxID=458696 RepID=UPI0018F80A2E|nr:uncharacterized protein LOC119995569 [Tripterygium wilfordii]